MYLLVELLLYSKIISKNCIFCSFQKLNFKDESMKLYVVSYFFETSIFFNLSKISLNSFCVKTTILSAQKFLLIIPNFTENFSLLLRTLNIILSPSY